MHFRSILTWVGSWLQFEAYPTNSWRVCYQKWEKTGFGTNIQDWSDFWTCLFDFRSILTPDGLWSQFWTYLTNFWWNAAQDCLNVNFETIIQKSWGYWSILAEFMSHSWVGNLSTRKISENVSETPPWPLQARDSPMGEWHVAQMKMTMPRLFWVPQKCSTPSHSTIARSHTTQHIASEVINSLFQLPIQRQPRVGKTLTPSIWSELWSSRISYGFAYGVCIVLSIIFPWKILVWIFWKGFIFGRLVLHLHRTLARPIKSQACQKIGLPFGRQLRKRVGKPKQSPFYPRRNKKTPKRVVLPIITHGFHYRKVSIFFAGGISSHSILFGKPR